MFNPKVKMRKSYKYRINPSQRKTKKLTQKLRICGWFYNFLYQLRINIWEKEQRKINYYEQQNILPKLKDQYPLLKKVHSQVIQGVVDRVNKAWKTFYEKQKKVTKLKEKLLELTDEKKIDKLRKILGKIKFINYPREKGQIVITVSPIPRTILLN